MFPIIAALELLFGVLLIMPIRSADTPTVIALLNSYDGLAACAMGFALNNKLLVIAGALDGASGFILSIVMCRAMNRSFGNVLFGAFGAAPEQVARSAQALAVHAVTPEDAAIQLAWARLVIVVPGYGMAVAQAQHQVRELAALVEKNGRPVLYPTPPAARRTP